MPPRLAILEREQIHPPPTCVRKHTEKEKRICQPMALELGCQYQGWGTNKQLAVFRVSMIASPAPSWPTLTACW